MPRCRTLTAVLLAALALVACGGEPVRPSAPEGSPSVRRTIDPAFAADLQRALERGRSESDTPGASAAVVLPGGATWTGAAGVTDSRTRDRATPETLFAVGSVTKPLMAGLVLKLVEDGDVSLDDRLSRWVPEFPGADGITVRQLLQHTAGLGDFVRTWDYGRSMMANPAAVRTPQRALRIAPPPVAEPGDRWSYANTGYILLGLVVERVTGADPAFALHHRLLPRADFPRVALQPEDRPRGRVATGHIDTDGDGRIERFPPDPYLPFTAEASAAWTAGGLVTDAGSLARAIHGMLAGDLLTERSRREMSRFVETDSPATYGLGLEHTTIGSDEAWGHAGAITGFHAEAWHFPEHGITVAALANRLPSGRFGSGPDLIGREVAAAALDDR